MIRQIDFCNHPEDARIKHHVMYDMFDDLKVPDYYLVAICNNCHQSIHRQGKRECGVTNRGKTNREIFKYYYMCNKAAGTLQYTKYEEERSHNDNRPREED